jgi:glycosyltransferase involved in cell wall biosynthesis
MFDTRHKTFHPAGPPVVSVVIPAFNAEETLSQAVNSVIHGTYQDFEILIADDASTDSTYEVAQTSANTDNRIRCFRNEHSMGVSKTRNELINNSQGKYVAFLDSDDTWEPNKLDICLRFLAENSHIKAVGHALRYLTEKNKRVGYLPARPSSMEELRTIQSTGALPHVYTTSAVVEKSILIQEAGFATDWPVGVDTELFARIAWRHGLLTINAPLGSYRIKSGSLTDKYWLMKRLSDSCVRENFKRLRKGMEPITIVEYEKAFLKNLYSLKNMARLRRLYSRHLLRKAGESWLCGNRVRSAILGAYGGLLAPVFTLSRFTRKHAANRASHEAID